MNDKRPEVRRYWVHDDGVQTQEGKQRFYPNGMPKAYKEYVLAADYDAAIAKLQATPPIEPVGVTLEKKQADDTVRRWEFGGRTTFSSDEIWPVIQAYEAEFKRISRKPIEPVGMRELLIEALEIPFEDDDVVIRRWIAKAQAALAAYDASLLTTEAHDGV